MDLSIIIAHYNPGNHPTCLDAFHKTISTINHLNFSIEIIIADDGSITNKNIPMLAKSKINQNDKNIFHLHGKSLEIWKKENNFDYPMIKH